ncbi:hypothetical protein ACHAQA_005837 [Verticillium albo-atrum]
MGSVKPAATSPADSVQSEFTISQIRTAVDLERFLPSLRLLLQSCVNPDPAASSLTFLAPLSDADATAYWLALWPSLSGSEPLVSLFVLTRQAASATTALGTVQLACNPKQTHAHKAEIHKLLVLPEERSHGLGRKLMAHAELFAVQELGRSMLLLDTATETPARGFYLKAGWTEWGICPEYAAYADGRKGDCSFFCKFLATPS